MSKRFIYYGKVALSFIDNFSMSFSKTTLQGITMGDMGAIATGVISVSAWVKLNDLVGRKTIFSDSTSGSTGQRLFWEVSSDKLRVIWNGVIIMTSTTPLLSNTWQHVMLIRTGSVGNWLVDLYIDGVLTDSATTTQSPNGVVSNVEIGIFSILPSLAAMDGKIDEVSVWDSDKTSNVASIYNGGTPNDLTALSPRSWWRMGDGDSFNGSDWTLIDNGSNSFDGTSINMDVTNRVTDTP